MQLYTQHMTTGHVKAKVLACTLSVSVGPIWATSILYINSFEQLVQSPKTIAGSLG